MRTLTLAVAMLSLVAVPALPDFIVLKKGEKSLDVLSRALGCELPAPQLPSLASGEKIQPDFMIDKNVFSGAKERKREGVIKDVVVDKENLTVNSVIKLTPALGAGYITVPVSGMKPDNGGFSLADERNTSLTTAAPSYSDDKFVSIVSPSTWGLWDVLRPPLYEIRIRVNSTPLGATFFARDKSYGLTEIEGLLNPASKESIRLEKQGYRPCEFSDGTYADPTATGPATFQCRLTAVKTP
jgi:hypothetical protein